MELDGTATVVGIKNVGDFTPMTKKLPPGFSDLRKNMIMIDYVTYMYMKKKRAAMCITYLMSTMGVVSIHQTKSCFISSSSSPIFDQNLLARSQPQRHGSRPGGPGANHWGLVGPSLASAEHAPWVSSGCFRTFPERTPSWSHDLEKPKGLRMFFLCSMPSVCPGGENPWIFGPCWSIFLRIHGFMAGFLGPCTPLGWTGQALGFFLWKTTTLPLPTTGAKRMEWTNGMIITSDI